MSDDHRWQRRLRLLDLLLLDTVDKWSVDDSEFPTEFVLCSVLYLFSPRCDPMTTRESGLIDHLGSMVQPPKTECSLAHPEQSSDHHELLIDRLSNAIQKQLAAWESGKEIVSDTIGAFAETIVDEIIQSKYVSFHCTQTTSRDNGGFHGLW